MPAAKSSTPKTNRKSAARKSSGRKSTKTAAPAPAPEPEPVPEPAPVVHEATATETASDAPTLDEQFKSLLTRITEVKTLAASLTSELRKLQKSVTKEVRDSGKRGRKRRGNTNADGTKRPPSGFAKPAKISDELCQFLGEPSGTEMARTEVTKYLTKYIKYCYTT